MIIFKNRFGYTLIELMIAVAIIGILTSLGISSYIAVNKQARDAKRKSDLENIRSSLESYRSENDYYPANLSPIVPSKFLNSIPNDPRLSPYYYVPQPTLTDTPGFSSSYVICADLEIDPVIKTGCGTCTTCNYKLGPLGAE